jgi:hypothetical protein
MRWVVHLARMREMRSVYNILVGKPKGKRPLRRPRRRREDNFRVDFREFGWESVDWMHLTQDRDQWRAVVSTIMNLLFP